eukprot:m.18036 g.18036  ORF g.18036 m.18036 type:complete len:431 (+) comp7278_c1_seq1:100-1392(+)
MAAFSLDEASLGKDPEDVFQLLEKLGEGAYGSVFKGLHKGSGAVVAIKQVPVESDLQDILKEISIMQQCENNFIVKCFGSYVKKSDLWIVMEFCGAGSVSDIIRLRNKTLAEAEILPILKATLRGLEYLHSKRKIHRDIKAGNILLNEQGEAKLADFGVAGQLSDTMAKRNTVIGTPFWMAPEVIQEIGYDCLADIWSLGVTVIEMAEGRPPYSDIHPMRAIFMIPTKPPPTLKQPELWSPDLRDFLTRCLVKNPADRASAVSLLQHPLLAATETVSPAVLAVIDEAQHIRSTQPALAQGSPEAIGTVQARGDATVVVGAATMIPAATSAFQTVKALGEEASTIKCVEMPGSSAVADYKPAFMAHFEQARDANPAPLPAAAPAVDLTELRRRLEALDDDLDRELGELHKLYDAKRQPIIAAINAKAVKSA